MHGNQDDAVTWMNYRESASPAEEARLVDIVGDERRATQLLAFGLRPPGILDEDCTIRPSPLDQPFDLAEEHLGEGNTLVDINTGCRFLFDSNAGDLLFDLVASNNCNDAFEILLLASNRDRQGLPFRHLSRPTKLLSARNDEAPLIPPLEFRTGSDGSLADIVRRLTVTLCEDCGATKLWFRGQRSEYPTGRDPQLALQLYGEETEASLVPSLGRMVSDRPDLAGFNLVFNANHSWKKPFLIWMILENHQWFESGEDWTRILRDVLSDSDDSRFARLLGEIQTTPSMFENSISGNFEWPDEVDDLRQWFFAFMKRQEFGVTLQQYGYPTSLLDVTDSLDVALYFSQARLSDGRLRVEPPGPGRLIYVFAERKTGDFFRHGRDLFWGSDGWAQTLPPRLSAQKAGFLMGASCRARNFYNRMVVAKIRLDDPTDITPLDDDQVFPYDGDLLYQTLNDSRPVLSELY